MFLHSSIIEQDYNFVKLSYVDKDDNDIFEKYKYLANSKFKDNYEDRLFLLIYAKTGIILAKQGDYLHEFLPNNFRQLNHFLFYLNSMEDIVSSENCSGVFKDILTFYDTSSKDNLPRLSSPLNRSSAVLEHSIETTSLWLKNLNIFKNYLLDTWCPARLSSQQLRIIENIEQSPSNIKNFNTVQMIKQIINDDRNKIGNEISDIREQPISNSQYTPMSDVIWALYRLQHTINPVNHFAFIYAVKMYYTIHLHMTALQGILKWLARRGNIIDDSPFSRLFDVLGGRIFPMHYYMKKRLPFYVFNIFNIDRASFLVPFMYKCEMAKRSVGISAAMYGNLNKKQNYFVDFRTPPLIKNMDGIISTSEYQFFDFLAPMMSLYRRSSVIDILNNVGDENIESPNGSKENAGVKALYSTLNLTCNLDLQDVIYKFFFKDPYPPEYSFEGNLLLFMGICNEFDASINDKMIINIKSQLEYVFSTIDNRVIRNFIIGNKDIENLYPLSTIGLYVGDMPFWKDTHDTDDIIAIFAVPSKSKKNDSFNKSKHKDLSLKPPEKQEHKPSNVNREDSDHKNTEKNEGKNKEKAVSESMNKIGQAEKEKAEKEKNDNKE